MDKDDELRIRSAFAQTRASVLALLDYDGIDDVALIGNSSDIYEWTPSKITDFDSFIFARKLDQDVGLVLERMRDKVTFDLGSVGVDFEFRIMRGSYKPNRKSIDRPVLLLHLGVFTDDSYREESLLKRWGWRKYPCAVDHTRLVRLVERPPTMDDLLYGPRGVTDKLRDLRRGTTVMDEWLLPALQQRRVSFDVGNWVFTEFCYSSAATTARHHARILGHFQADQLSNDEYFEWYDTKVMPSSTLLPLMAMKKRSRIKGYYALLSDARQLAIDFLETVLTHGRTYSSR